MIAESLDLLFIILVPFLQIISFNRFTLIGYKNAQLTIEPMFFKPEIMNL